MKRHCLIVLWWWLATWRWMASPCKNHSPESPGENWAETDSLVCVKWRHAEGSAGSLCQAPDHDSVVFLPHFHATHWHVTADTSLKLNHVTFNNHHISEHTCERRISWLSLWKLLHICTLFIEYARVFHLNLWAPGEEQTPGAFSTQNLICVSEALADAERSSALQSQEKDILWFTALCPQKHLPGAAEMPKNEYDSPPNDSVRWLHSVKWTLKQNLKKVLVNIF